MLGSGVMEGHWGVTGGGNVRACWDETRRWDTGATGVGFWGTDRMSKLPLVLSDPLHLAPRLLHRGALTGQDRV